MNSVALPPFLQSIPLLVLVAGAALLVSFFGALLARRLPVLGRALGTAGNVALIGVLALTGLRFVQIDPALDALLPQFGMPAQSVAGGETRVPLSSDGHFWIEASVNGTSQRFMVDTGATLSALSAEAARTAGVRPGALGVPMIVRTANGSTTAQLARVDDLRFGNIVARDLDTLITGATGGLNVLGMNFLSRLKGWRVEDGVLILSPRNQATSG